MIGTSFEMLYYMSLLHDTQVKLNTTRKRMNKLRERIVRQIISENEVIELLSRLDCQMVRPKYIIPPIIQDKRGRIYDGDTFLKCYNSKKYMQDNTRDGKTSLYEERLNSAVAALGAKIIEPERILPSVWSYEPEIESWLPQNAQVVQKMLGFDV